MRAALSAVQSMKRLGVETVGHSVDDQGRNSEVRHSARPSAPCAVRQFVTSSSLWAMNPVSVRALFPLFHTATCASVVVTA